MKEQNRKHKDIYSMSQKYKKKIQKFTYFLKSKTDVNPFLC
jgi:hypothetical protein